jgi:hypothetical protein
MDRARRKELTAEYRRTRQPAGVYLIRCAGSGLALLGASTNLDGTRNKVEFARSTDMPGALDGRLRADFERFGGDAFSFEVLDRLDVPPEATEADLRSDLAALEALWREKLDPAGLY